MFCRVCVASHPYGSSECRHCGKPFKPQAKISKITQNIINALEFECDKCSTTFYFKHFEDHKKVCGIKEETITLLIKDWQGKTLSFHLKLSDEIRTLKEKVSDKTGVHPDLIILISGGRCLDSNRKLSDYNIQNMALILMSSRLSGD